MYRASIAAVNQIYFYLLFNASALEFERVIFTTEAHPIRKAW